MKCGNIIPNPEIPDVEEPYGHGILLEIERFQMNHVFSLVPERGPMCMKCLLTILVDSLNFYS